MVRGIGFDATCSMVCLDQNGQPLSVSPSGKHISFDFCGPHTDFINHFY